MDSSLEKLIEYLSLSQMDRNELEADSEIPSSVVFVETEEKLVNAVDSLSKYDTIALDAEGVNLGRRGPLTILTLQGLGENVRGHEDSPVYVVDVEILRGDRVFSKSLPSFQGLLQDSAITKVTFDCRRDSEALFHQFGVLLTGVLDLQVFDQAVRIHKGELPPAKNKYLTYGTPFVPGMEKALSRYKLSSGEAPIVDKSFAPHKFDTAVWKVRPLSVSCIKYASNDVDSINFLWRQMKKEGVPKFLMEKVALHSKRYEGMFRDCTKEVDNIREKYFVMEEHPIILEHELPPVHPRNPREARSLSEEAWNKAVTGLHSKTTTTMIDDTYRAVMFILHHRSWYTDEGRKELKKMVKGYPFTSNQRRNVDQYWLW